MHPEATTKRASLHMADVLVIPNNGANRANASGVENVIPSPASFAADIHPFACDRKAPTRKTRVPMARVLVVDDDPNAGGIIAEVVREEGYEVVMVNTFREGKQRLAQETWDVVFCDLMLDEQTGLVLLRQSRELPNPMPFVLITGAAELETAVSALRLGALAYLSKPAPVEQVLTTLKKALRGRSTQRPPTTASMVEPVTRIIGRSRAMVEVYNSIGRAAMSDSPVLVLGEMGVGKELVAQEIHKYSARSNGQFITLNCAAMAADDFERELLRIATHSPRPDGAASPTPCTLFLKHVNELPPAVQQRLARIIDHRSTGASREPAQRYRDIRYIASVTGGPEQADAMRRELFYALSVIQIVVPPLSQRLDDLPALAEHLLRKIEPRVKKNLSISPGAMKLLREHHWQGNMRELANALEKAAVMSPRTELREEEFQHLMAARLDPARVMRPIAEVEREHILSVFAQCGGDLDRTAGVLGMSQSDIKRKLNAFASAAGGRSMDSSSACAACGHIYTSQEAARCNHKCPRCVGVEGAILVPTHPGDRGLPSDVPKFKSNRYVLYKLIDRSEFSEVWAGWQPSLCRRVVIKFLTAQDPSLLERFKREARIQATLRHPHIPAVYEAGTDELCPDQMFLAIEFIEGTALDQHSKDLMAKGNEKDRIHEVLTLGRQIALALDYVHTQGLVHRDLKPQNIIATKNQCAYLIDYGITRSFHSEERLTSEGYILGTVPFMAPEQFTGDVKGLDGRTDIWGLGATLYYVLTGHLPFPGTKFEEVAQLIASAPPQSPRQICPALNEETEQMLLRALEKSPHLRFARASDMAAAIQTAMDRC